MGKTCYETRAFRWRGRLTTIKLEPEWWRLLADLCQLQGRRSCDVLSDIERQRGRGNRAAAVRLYIVNGFAEAVRPHATMHMIGNDLPQDAAFAHPLSDRAALGAPAPGC